jgi:hypothetical protein
MEGPRQTSTLTIGLEPAVLTWLFPLFLFRPFLALLHHPLWLPLWRKQKRQEDDCMRPGEHHAACWHWRTAVGPGRGLFASPWVCDGKCCLNGRHKTEPCAQVEWCGPQQTRYSVEIPCAKERNSPNSDSRGNSKDHTFHVRSGRCSRVKRAAPEVRGEVIRVIQHGALVLNGMRRWEVP